MWELSIVVDMKNVDIAKFIYHTLKNKTSEFGAVVTCYQQHGDFFVLIGCPEEEHEKIASAIERCLVRVICNFYKDKFLSRHLRLPSHENISLMAFKKALINFDKETDFYIISKSLQLKKNFHLDSFYHFKLKGLRDKWTELITLANDNSDYLVSNDAFYDLLKFLIDNLEVCEEEIDVFENEKGYFLKANHPFETDSESLSEEALVSSLIELCPKKINFFCRSDDNAIGFLSKIFKERVNLCCDGDSEKIENFSFLK